MGVLARLTAVVVAVTLGVAGCVTHTETEGTVLTVGMSPGPYSIIFKDGIEPLLKAKGYTVNYHVYRDLNEATDAWWRGMRISAWSNTRPTLTYITRPRAGRW